MSNNKIQYHFVYKYSDLDIPEKEFVLSNKAIETRIRIMDYLLKHVILNEECYESTTRDNTFEKNDEC
jgi:hypothetical protein